MPPPETSDQMSKFLAFIVLWGCLVAQPSLGREADAIGGTWKLISYEVEVQATGQKFPPMGTKTDWLCYLSARGSRIFHADKGGAQACQEGPRARGTIEHPHCL